VTDSIFIRHDENFHTDVKQRIAVKTLAVSINIGVFAAVKTLAVTDSIFIRHDTTNSCDGKFRTELC
jgi:hypothetical protein